MDWRGRRQSRNIEDRRGQPLQGSGGGIGLLLVLRLLPWLLGTRAGRIMLGLGVVVFFVLAALLRLDEVRVLTRRFLPARRV